MFSRQNEEIVYARKECRLGDEVVILQGKEKKYMKTIVKEPSTRFDENNC